MKRLQLLLALSVFIFSGLTLRAENRALEIYAPEARHFRAGSNIILTNHDATIELWVNLLSTSVNGQFVQIGTSNSANGYGIGVGGSNFDNAGNDLIVLYDQLRWIDTNVPIGTGWHHIALVLNTYGQPIIYLDGVQIYSDAGVAPGVPAGALGATTVGGNYGSPGRWISHAYMDEIRLWNDMRSIDEIKNNMHFELGNPTQESNLAAYYQCNDNVGSVIVNKTGNANYNGNFSTSIGLDLSSCTVSSTWERTTIYVDKNATGANNGSSWTDAFTSLQSALDLNLTHDIWVAKGTYYPSQMYGGESERYKAFQLRNNVAIYGGFTATETSIDQRVDFGVNDSNATILSGDIGTLNDSTDNCYHVIYNTAALALDSTAVLNGFSIRHGNASVGGDLFPVATEKCGGGVYNEGGSPQFVNCSFYDNAGIKGGALFETQGSAMTVINCLFFDNYAKYQGAAIHSYFNCNSTYINVTITNNYTAAEGGGVYNQYLVNSMYINSIIYHNRATNAINSTIYNNGGTPSFTNCNIENSGGSAAWASATGTDLGHNIDQDPMFVGDENNANHPYSIYGVSPCVDAGIDTLITLNWDIRGLAYARKLIKSSADSGTIDMGAYEYKLDFDPLTFPVIYVNSNAIGNEDGSSWDNAFTSLQDALDFAVGGQDVWVAKGTYLPSQEADGTTDTPRDFCFQMMNNVAVIGGFSGTETDMSERMSYGVNEINETTLSGDIGTLGDSTDNCIHIIYHPSTLGLDSTAVLDGFSLKHGNSDGTFPHNMGSAIQSYLFSSLTVRNCTFTQNTGTAVFIMKNTSTLLFENVNFIDNDAPVGGTMYISNGTSQSVIKDCRFSHNRTDKGGGLYIEISPVIIKNCLIDNNTAVNNGGGVFIQQAEVEVVNTTIVDNTANNGGAFFNFMANPLLVNSILWNNIALLDSDKNEFFNQSAIPLIAHSNIKGSGASGSGWDTALGTDLGNNLDSIPQFLGEAEHPYSLYGISPCVDAGIDSVIMQNFDFRGSSFARKLDGTTGLIGTIDMGAYEYKYDVDIPYPLTIFVDLSASGMDNGSSWENAYTSLQSALDAVIDGQKVWVAKGTYKPESAYDLADTPQNYHFRMIDGIQIFGGFNGSESSVDERVSFGHGEVNETILSGNIGDSEIDTDNCYHVIYNDNLSLSASTILDGFTITKGHSTLGQFYDNSACGGGILNVSGANKNYMIISNCTFFDNYVKGSGGAIYNIGTYTYTTMTHCTFIYNTAESGGGAIANYYAEGVIKNCVIANNTANDTGGGGISIGRSKVKVINTTITGNTSNTNSSNYGGGGIVIVTSQSAPIITNCIIWGNSNTNDNSRNEIYEAFSPTPTITYCDVEGGYTGTGNINDNPYFADPFSDDYRLTKLSPCSDVGLDSVLSDTTDIRGVDRKIDGITGLVGTVDMGAYEFQVATDPERCEITANITQDGDTLVCDIEGGHYQWLAYDNGVYSAIDGATEKKFAFPEVGSYAVYVAKESCMDTSDYITIVVTELASSSQNELKLYPNPSTGRINIVLTSADQEAVVKVQDLSGREVYNKTYNNSKLISFDLDGNAGIYLIQISTADTIFIRKVIKR